MRLSRIITALVAGLAVAGAPTAAGAAQPFPPQPSYPPQPPSLTANPATINLGQTTTLVGVNFGGNEVVDIVVSRTPLNAAGVLDGQSARRGGGGARAMGPGPYGGPRQPPPPPLPGHNDGPRRVGTRLQARESGG